ncbi:hypothetical protein VTN77DRAFT_6346 [Rasamsonia byssochlamydoides]|uniref:uncharacterized protein n=1 Tax=Rasamsonia byssochlamydoides TaxID=89139 RepID=UPI003743ACD4
MANHRVTHRCNTSSLLHHSHRTRTEDSWAPVSRPCAAASSARRLANAASTASTVWRAARRGLGRQGAGMDVI